jgi:hypothetical protein
VASSYEPNGKVPFVGSVEQCFLVAYRAVCLEAYRKLSLTATNTLAARIARSVDAQRGGDRHSKANRVREDWQSIGLRDAQQRKGIFDAAGWIRASRLGRVA